MAVTWEPLVRLISNLEKAHPQGPSNVPGKFQLDRSSGCRETAVIDTDTETHRDTQRHTETHRDTQTQRDTDTQTQRDTDTIR